MKILAGIGLLLLAGTAFAQAPQSRDREAGSARWTERLVRNDNTWQCGDPRTDCTTLQLVVDNKSDEELFCKGSIRFAQPNGHRIADVTDKKAQIETRGSGAVAYSLAPIGMAAAGFETDCMPVSKLPRSQTPAIQDVTCRHRVIQPVNFDDYYPPDAKAEKREGKVLMEFTLAASPSSPTDVKVRESSGHADLDAAGMRAIRAMKFETSCPGDRSRFVIVFGLK